MQLNFRAAKSTHVMLKFIYLFIYFLFTPYGPWSVNVNDQVNFSVYISYKNLVL